MEARAIVPSGVATPPSKQKPFQGIAPSPEPPSEGFSDAPAPRKRHREDLELWTEGGNLVDFSANLEYECPTPAARRPRLFSNQPSSANLFSLFSLHSEEQAVQLEDSHADMLPSEIWTVIFSHLPFKEVCELRGLCTLFRTAADDLADMHVEFCTRKVPCDAIVSRMVGLKTLTIAHSSQDDSSVRDLCTVLKKRGGNGRFVSNINTICLRGNTISSGGATALAEAITLNHSITSLDVCSNDIGRTGAVAFAEALKRPNNLRHLNLSFNTIGRRGAMALADALRRPHASPNLASLDISVNEIRNEGVAGIAEALKMHPLQSLSVGGNGISKDGAISLARSLVINHHLKVLNLGSNPIGPLGSAAIGAALVKNTNIHSIRLAHCDMEETGATAFAKALRVNTTLVELSIYANNVKSTGCMQIADALRENLDSAVNILDLSVNEIDDAGTKGLSALLKAETCKLSTLDLRGNLIGDCGAQELAVALEDPACSLSELDLSNNCVSDEASADLAHLCRETGLSLLA